MVVDEVCFSTGISSHVLETDVRPTTSEQNRKHNTWRGPEKEKKTNAPRVGHVRGGLSRHVCCLWRFLTSVTRSTARAGDGRCRSGGVAMTAGTAMGVAKVSMLLYTLTLAASLAGFLFGYDTGYISAVLVSVGGGLGGSELTHKQAEYISSATSFGALISALFAGVLADIYGRRTAIMFCDVLFFIGAMIQILAMTVPVMVFGRFIMGLGVGIGSLCAPLYISELAPSHLRGRLVTINCLAITGGQLVAYSIGAMLNGVSNGWRLIIALSLLPCTAQFYLMHMLPETPRYLISVSRLDDAAYVLKQIHSELSNDEVLDSITLIQDSCTFASSFHVWKTSFIQLFTNSANLRSLAIACGLQFFQQFVGFNALMYYSSTIFSMIGFNNSTAVSCVIAGTNMVVTIIAVLIIDKVGRRRILLYSIPLLFLSQLTTSVSFHLQSKYLLLVSLILFVAFYAIGLGNVPWQQSELFPQTVRAAGSSLSTATNWFGSMTVSFFFLTLVNKISASLTFIIFSLITFQAFLFVYFLYPELSNLQLEKVQEILTDGFNVQKSVELYHGYNSVLN